MNHGYSSRPGGRNKPSDPPANPAGRLGLTPQQGIILAIVAILGLAAMALAAKLLLGGGPTSAAQARVMATLTSFPVSPAQASSGTQTAPAAYPLPQGCAQTGESAVQGLVTRVIDSGSLEVQVDGSPMRIGFAGITVSPAAPDILILNELVGKPVILVKDVSAQDDAGRATRYVFAAGQFINLELVQEGAATILTNSPDQACKDLLFQAQQQAQAGRQGIWKLTPAPTQTFMPLVSLVPSTQVAGCDCSTRPTCDQFKTHAAAQACYNACQDYNTRLDDNHNGIACENLP